MIDPATRALTGTDRTAGYVRPALEASLRRLGTDRVDLLQLPIGDLSTNAADDVAAACEELVEAGLVRSWGWSTDDADRAAAMVGWPHFSSVQHMPNVLHPASAIVALCEREGLAALARSPLAMGLLRQRVDASTRFADDDIRSSQAEWMPWFDAGRPAEGALHARAAVREVLTSNERSLAQGAIAWLWAVSPVVVQIPGCRTVAQVEDNAGALSDGALSDAERDEVERLLGRSAPTAQPTAQANDQAHDQPHDQPT